MTLRDSFPTTSAAYPGLANWDAEFEWTGVAPMAVAGFFRDAIEQAQGADRQPFFDLAETIRGDLTAETRRIGDDEGAVWLDAMRFIISIPAIMTTVAMGAHGDCYNWLHWSASRTHNVNLRANQGDYRLPPYDGVATPMNAACLRNLTDWITAAFMIARKFGGMDDWCDQIADYCIAHVLDEIVAGDVVRGVPAIVTIANWATNRGHKCAEPLVSSMAEIYGRPGIDDRSKATMAVLFTTAAAQWTRQTHQEWAKEALRDLRHVLVEHEVVQLLAVTIDDYEDWTAARVQILGEVRKLADEYRALETGPAAILALEARVAIIHPLIFSLTEIGTVADIMDLLWAWYGVDGIEQASADVLYIGSAHKNGVAYLWPGGRHLIEGDEDGESLEGLLAGLSTALNEYFRGPAGDRALLLDERMLGAPAHDKAPELTAAIARHYRFGELAPHLPEGWRPRSVVVMPAHRDPVQATLSNILGWLAPMEASLAAPLQDRTTRCVSIWPGETQTTEAEVSFIRAVGLHAGWEVKVVEAPLDQRAFQAFYEDADADLVWVIGHGEQSPFRQSESGLVLADGTVLTSAEIAAYARPETGRRLLVLNICSATATQNRGGLARIGFGHELTTADQSVIGHLWPIDYYAALAFGCSLSLDLAGSSVAEALASTMARMQQPERLIRDFETVDATQEAISRLRSERAAEQISNLLSWGSPVLLT